MVGSVKALPWRFGRRVLLLTLPVVAPMAAVTVACCLAMSSGAVFVALSRLLGPLGSQRRALEDPGCLVVWRALCEVCTLFQVQTLATPLLRTATSLALPELLSGQCDPFVACLKLLRGP